MRMRMGFILGGAVGYVLGTAAGRERFEQMKGWVDKLGNSKTIDRTMSRMPIPGRDRTIDLDATPRTFDERTPVEPL